MYLIHAAMPISAFFVASSHDLMLFLFEDITQVLLQLSDLILLIENFFLENNILVLHLGIRAHLSIPLLHRVHDLVASLHACVRVAVVSRWVIELAGSGPHGA